MFKNSLTTAINNLLGDKLYSGINILGLAFGLAATILIALSIAWVTVGSTTARAANRNPVLALRYE